MQADPHVSTSLGLDEWLARLSEPNGAPGGGSVAGVMMALAAALLHMVCGYTTGSPAADAIAQRVRLLRERALTAAAADGVRSVALGAALASDAPSRDEAVHREAVAAASSSADLAEIGIALVAELRAIAAVGNPNLDADSAVAGESLRAGIGAALVNLGANVRLARAHGAGEETTAADLARILAVGDRGRRARIEVDDVLSSLPRR